MAAPRTSLRGRSRRELAIDLSHIVGKLPSDGYLIITDLPAGARLSQGHDNGDRTWTVFFDEVAGLKFLPGELRGVVSLNALIFNLEPGSKKLARQIPLVLHTDDGVEWPNEKQAPAGGEGGRSSPSQSAAVGETGNSKKPPTGEDSARLIEASRQVTLASPERQDQGSPVRNEAPDPAGDTLAISIPSAEPARAEGAATPDRAECGSGPDTRAAAVQQLFTEAEQRWAAEVDRVSRHSLAVLRQETRKVLGEVEQRHAAEFKEISEAVMKQHGIIAALKSAAERTKEEAAIRFSEAENAWRQAEADRMNAAQQTWTRQEEALKGELGHHLAAVEQLETELRALREESAARERDLQQCLADTKGEAERRLQNARSEWQRQVAAHLESAAVEILAVFDRSGPSR
jgi:hypothetical protein